MNDYQQDFGLRGVRVCSSGKLEDLYNTYAADPNPILYIIDEAHRYRNELSDAYQWLHQLTRSHAENKVVLLTATPYNNRPQDLFALIKLFQTPSRSTIHSVDNLGVRFHELIAQYNRLEKEGKKGLTSEIKYELDQLIENGVDIISVRGTSVARFLEIAKILNTEVLIIPDNDGKASSRLTKYSAFTSATIKLAMSNDDTLFTLEKILIHCNGRDKLNKILGKKYATDEKFALDNFLLDNFASI